MAKKSTKNRNIKKLTRRQIRRRQERIITALVFAFLFVCVGAFASIGLLNSHGTDRTASQWIVTGQNVEILPPAAPVAAETLNQPATVETARQTAGTGAALPFLNATEAPVTAVQPAATEAPRPTMAPLPTAVPTAAPTDIPDEVLPERAMISDYVPITVTAVGDCTLGGDIRSGAYKSFESYADKYGYDYFFKNVRGLFESDDLTIVNLEGPLTTSTDMRSGRQFNFRGDPEYVKILSGSSVEIANVANNHAMDFGEAGFSETAEVLRGEGIGVSGFSYVHFENVKGVTVGSLGFTEWAYSQEQIEQKIRLARENCQLLIVSVHWGEESIHEPTDTQVRLGRAMIDAGADLVIGNHSHVYGGVEMYKDKYIIYSLGNFCFGGNRNPRDKNCTIFQQTFNIQLDGTVSDGGIRIIPALVSTKSDTNDFQPMILTGDKVEKRLKMIADVSTVDPAKVIWLDDAQSNSNPAVALGASA